MFDCHRYARTRDACDHDESGTVIVFCYGGTRGFDKYTRYIVRERVRAPRAVRTRGAPQLIKVL